MEEKIRELFDELGRKEQIEIMVELYYSMDDGQKDRFLEETENA